MTRTASGNEWTRLKADLKDSRVAAEPTPNIGGQWLKENQQFQDKIRSR